MSSPAVSCVRHLIDEYRRFLRSTYRLADPKLRAQFEEHIDHSDVLVKGPYVTLARKFATGSTLPALLADNVGYPDLAALHWPFGYSPLFSHQEKALRLVDGVGRNCVVKTGTGSGKTEAFLLPVVSGVMRMRKEGITGTKAILLYPMNALANDQLVRIRNLIRDRGTTVTFAMYTGDSERVAGMIGEPVDGNELVDRAKIRSNPPDILLTNYKQLEFLLVRRADRSLFSPSLRYLVLDEIHSYRGALATEIACLIRRLKSRCGLERGGLRCIGTSATVAAGAGGDAALAAFVADLFGEEFTESDVLGEETVPRGNVGPIYTPPFPEIRAEELEEYPVDDEVKLLELAQRLTGLGVPQEGSATAKVAAMLRGNEVVNLLDEACTEPASFTELIGKIRASCAAAEVVPDDRLRTLIEAYLLVGSIGTPEDPPVLRPKLHTFFHGIYDVGLCINPTCRILVRDGADTCPQCHSVVRPAVLCRTCGQDFVKVRFPEDEGGVPLPNDSFQSDETTGFITPMLHVETGDEEGDEPDEGDDGGRRKRRKHKSKPDRLADAWICHACGMVHMEDPATCHHCGSRDGLTVQKLLRGKGNTCPACNSTYTRGDILTLLRSGIASTNSLLATHHLDRLTGDDRKLILFADNRQEAAHQAGYMGDRHRQFTLRHAIESVVRALTKEGSSLVDLPTRLITKLQEINLIPMRIGQDDRRKWLKTLEIESAGEFCRATHQRISLENLALVEVQYEFLDELTGDQAFAAACAGAGISAGNGSVFVRVMLDRMRRNRAVSFDFFQRYIDPDREPWSLLTSEPWSVSFPEHERGPSFYMLDRSEAARHHPSGFTFHGITRDTERGGGGLFSLAKRAGIRDATRADAWLRAVIGLLQECEILVPPPLLPPRVRTAIGNGRPLQVASNVIRLVAATSGYRCQRCQIWRPYRGLACFSTKCRGELQDLKEAKADYEQYYVRLYTRSAPGRMRVAEHTAQIAQEQRAQREMDFKGGRLDTLVCSPTLELGVDIGPLVTVLMRNCPPTPANYVQRAGRAGRRLRIGFVSTFCGMGPHDRHCFEDPPWLVRGQFFPPIVRLDNEPVIARHVRSFVLENIPAQFPDLLGDLLNDIDRPQAVNFDAVKRLLAEITAGVDDLVKGAAATFIHNDNLTKGFLRGVVAGMPAETERILHNWFQMVRRLYDEFVEYRTITADRQSKLRAAARERAYREITTNRDTAYVLNYLSTEGLLPSYQFPTDTFSLEPGVHDTPTLRRPAWIALFEFVPGNLVYANGHKLKSIRAFFEGQSRGLGGDRQGSLEASGRVRTYCFCNNCGHAGEDVRNNCPDCSQPLSEPMSVAFVESFEAEQSTQITSAEEARERAYFERKDHLIAEKATSFEIFPYPFTQLELCRRSKVLVTNWGKRRGFDGDGERFDLCPNCGKHRPTTLTPKMRQRWEEDHAKRCSGTPAAYVLGYEFCADALVLPIAPELLATDEEHGADPFARTLGSAMVAGVVELLEIEPDEIAFFYHQVASGGVEIVFYETVPGGAGYLPNLAQRLGEWSGTALQRLFNHECMSACYRCLKSYRNQPFHKFLDKRLVQDVLFQFSCSDMLGSPFEAKRGDGTKRSETWITTHGKAPMRDTVIERRLLEAIVAKGRLPAPTAQREFKSDFGVVLTVADFAYEAEKIAIYCDGFAFHGSKDKLASDSQKRNDLQAQGWVVLTFWGQTILKYPERCEEQVWQAYQARRVGDSPAEP